MAKNIFAYIIVMILVISIGSCTAISKAPPPAPEPALNKPEGKPREEEKKDSSAKTGESALSGLRGDDKSSAADKGSALSETGEIDEEWAVDSSRPATTTSKEKSGSVPSSSGLKAGFGDDNKQFNYFINFLKDYELAPHYPININERIILSIKDKNGKSLPDASVSLYSQDNTLLCQGKSYADGTFLFFPSEYGRQSAAYKARVVYMQTTKEVQISRYGIRNVDVVMDLVRPQYKNVPLDIVFILDTTGSMGEEIERLRTTIEIINMNLVALSSSPRVRFGMVLYRDWGNDEEYITQVIPLTGDIDHFRAELEKVYADGGGDYPEDLQSALEDTIKKIVWAEQGIRLGFIITDAPPHLDYGQTYTYVNAVHDAREKGIKIFSVGAGGLDVTGEYVLRQISQYTYAKYIFLTYGETGDSTGGTQGSVSHHTGANFQTDKLESIIIRFAKEELSQLTDQPLDEGEDYFQAVKIQTEDNEVTLRKLFDMAINQLVDYSSIKIAAGTRAGVIPVISTDPAYNLDAEYFTDQLISALSNNQVFKMVERKDLQGILDELKLQLSGLVDDTSAVKVGSVLGAEMLISGKMYKKGDNYEIFLKLLRVETAEVLGVTKAIIAKQLGLSK